MIKLYPKLNLTHIFEFQYAINTLPTTFVWFDHVVKAHTCYYGKNKHINIRTKLETLF